MRLLSEQELDLVSGGEGGPAGGITGYGYTASAGQQCVGTVAQVCGGRNGQQFNVGVFLNGTPNNGNPNAPSEPIQVQSENMCFNMNPHQWTDAATKVTLEGVVTEVGINLAEATGLVGPEPAAVLTLGATIGHLFEFIFGGFACHPQGTG